MNLIVFPLIFDGHKRLGVKNLNFHKDFPKLMKQVPGSRWTPLEKCWHFPYEKKHYEAFLLVLKGISIEEKLVVNFNENTKNIPDPSMPK